MVQAPPGYPRPFGQYLLLSPLAHGGMGEVFLASQRSSGAVRLVVIKTLRPDLANEPGYVNRFLDEARIVVQLQHVNICQVFDVGKQDGSHYFAMEHIAGTNVRRLLDALAQAHKSLPPSIALYLVAEMLEGLAAAHRHRHPLTGKALNVVHRDVSPHNVMVSFEGDVKLIDFGLAASEMKMEHTESQVVMGKIAYMSPEQARGEPVDASSDQFSAAIVLYELLVGERFYGDMNQREIWSTAGSRGYVPPRWGQLTDDVAAVLKRALAEERKERFPTCGEFASALRVILKQRYPFADKAMLRSFVRDAVAQELEASESTLRNLGSLAMTAMPTDDESRTFAPRSGEISRDNMQPRDLRAPAEMGTGSTRTWMVFGKQRRGGGWQMAALAGFGGLAIGALFFVVLPRVLEPTVPPSTVPSSVPSPVGQVAAPGVDAVVQPVSDPVVDDGIKPVDVAVTADAGVAVALVADTAIEPTDAKLNDAKPTDVKPTDVKATDAKAADAKAADAKADAKKKARIKEREREAREKEKERDKAPSAELRKKWAGWNEAARLQWLSTCDHRCVSALKNTKARGETLTPAALESCFEKCAIKK
jgi:eukaryotic-like serine/threonine-protein kinase